LPKARQRTSNVNLAEHRVALVVGNSAYQSVPALANPVNDANAIAAALRKVGFSEVLEVYDANLTTIAKALKDFGDLDGEGPNSPFAEALSKYLTEPGLEIGLLFRKVRDAVYTRTGKQQEPFTYGSLPAQPFFFKQ